MPNHVTNRLTICGDAAVIAECKAKIKSKQRGAIDFNKIFPMPKGIQGTTSPTRIVTPKVRMEQIAARKAYIKEHGNKDYAPSVDLTKRIYDNLMMKYGFSNWYEWSVHNWGTKWNAYSVKTEGDIIVFDTAWSIPKEVMIELSYQFQELDFVIEFADEDLGRNCGIAVFVKGGVTINHMDGDEDFARRVTGGLKL